MKKVWLWLIVVLLILFGAYLTMVGWKYYVLENLNKRLAQYEKEDSNFQYKEVWYTNGKESNIKTGVILGQDGKISFDVGTVKQVWLKQGDNETAYLFMKEPKQYTVIPSKSPIFNQEAKVFNYLQEDGENKFNLWTAMTENIYTQIIDGKKCYVLELRQDHNKLYVDKNTGLPVKMTSPKGELLRTFEYQFGNVNPDELKVDTEGYSLINTSMKLN